MGRDMGMYRAAIIGLIFGDRVPPNLVGFYRAMTRPRVGKYSTLVKGGLLTKSPEMRVVESMEKI